MNGMFSPTFHIGSIRIGTVTSASAVNIGNNWPTNFRSQTKYNQGFGNIGGRNHQIRGTQSFMNDPDAFDMLTVPSGTDIPDWLKQLIPGALEGVQKKS